MAGGFLGGLFDARQPGNDNGGCAFSGHGAGFHGPLEVPVTHSTEHTSAWMDLTRLEDSTSKVGALPCVEVLWRI